MQPHLSPNTPRAFTLVEVIVVIAIIGIMTSLVVTVYRNVAQDSRDVVARQQQASLQNAVNNWITFQTTRRDIASVRAEYNGASLSSGRLLKIRDYLDDRSYGYFADHTSGGSDQVKSEVLNKLNKHLQLSTWGVSSYPQVQMKDNP